jgi:preprotein translocase subunit YajC
MQDAIEVGDEIITAGGLHGRIVSDEGETVRVELAPGVGGARAPRGVAAGATEVEVEAEPVEEADEPPPDPASETVTKPR